LLFYRFTCRPASASSVFAAGPQLPLAPFPG